MPVRDDTIVPIPRHMARGGRFSSIYEATVCKSWVEVV